APKYISKFIHAQSGKPLKSRIDQFLARLKLGSGGRRRLAVPGADILADVTPKNVPAHSGPQVFRNCSSFFDGQIRNATVRIELIRTYEGVCRTCIDAARTGAAPVWVWQIYVQFERREDHPEEEPGSKLLIKNAGVLANPADAGILRVDALNKRSGVDVTAGLEHLAHVRDFLPQAAFNFAQPAHHCFVIILLAPRVA